MIRFWENNNHFCTTNIISDHMTIYLLSSLVGSSAGEVCADSINLDDVKIDISLLNRGFNI